MQFNVVAGNPFAVLTAIVAPAILTNASSVLAQGTSNRLARHRSHPRRCRAVGFLRTGHRRLSSMVRAVGAAACARATPGQGTALLLRWARIICCVRACLRGWFDRELFWPRRCFLQCRHACRTYRRVCGLWIMRWLCLDGSRNAPRGEILGRGSQNPSASSPSPAPLVLVSCSRRLSPLLKTRRVLRS